MRGKRLPLSLTPSLFSVGDGFAVAAVLYFESSISYLLPLTPYPLPLK